MLGMCILRSSTHSCNSSDPKPCLPIRIPRNAFLNTPMCILPTRQIKWQTEDEIHVSVFFKPFQLIPICSQIWEPFITIPQRNSCMFTKLENVHSSIICITKKWKQHKCPSTEEWINKMWCTRAIEYYCHRKKWSTDAYHIMDESWKHYTNERRQTCNLWFHWYEMNVQKR